jgi:hypothetical protein
VNGSIFAPSRDASRQCSARDANEATERSNAALEANGPRSALRCECGDASCVAHVTLTHAEYEAVRASGTQFAICVNHENPENACVLNESAHFAVIDVIVGAARYEVRAHNPRHAWVDATTAEDTGVRPLYSEGSTR